MSRLFENFKLYQILRIFLEDPLSNFQMRQIGRMVKLSNKSALIYLNKLKTLDLIKIDTTTLYKSYKANSDLKLFQEYKLVDTLTKISESGLMNYLEEKFLPKCIILYGSCAKGLDTLKSDMDIFIQAKEKKADVSKYNAFLKRKIHLLFEENISNISKELLNNLCNGIVLSGFLRVKK